MREKHIRTIIILALILLAVAVTAFNLDIEPAGQPTQVVQTSSIVEEAEKRQEEAVEAENSFEEEKSAVPVKEDTAEPETEPYQEQKTETKKELSLEEKKPENEKEAPSEEKGAEIKQEVKHAETPAENSIEANTEPKNEQSSPADVEEDKTPATPKKHFCTIEIRCDTVVDTSKLENQAVAPYVPKNGTILKVSEMEFTPGESVFDILLRATKERNIHMEFRDENSYSGKYIEGINYLYEMDAGPLSGWMYKVNEKFPNYGCAAYKVEDNDAIVWIYTCDLGVDVGDNSKW